MAIRSVQQLRWSDMPAEKVTDLLDRRIINGQRMMLAQVLLKRGCVVPMHDHDNEQLSQIQTGALRFWIGDEAAEPIDVRAGEVLAIPSGVPHKAEALEDTVVVDAFCPPRQDWLDGSDTYLRKG